MVKLAFITGITGQDGSYLSELLLEKNYEVHGIVRRTSLMFTTNRIEHIKNKIFLHYGDLTDGMSLNGIIHSIIKNKDIEVFEIYNLGAQSHVKISFENPEYTSLVDGIGVLKLLEIIRTLPDNIKNKTKFYQAGTSEMFGDVIGDEPQDENTVFRPQSPYACAKVYAHNLVKNYRNSYNIFACNGILFNHESSRRTDNFVTMKIIKGIKNICDKKQEYISLGNIYSKRDWGHSKEYVKGMWLMLQQSEPDDYVLATNSTTSIKEFIIKCFKYKNIDIEWKNEGLDEIAIDVNTKKTVVCINEKYFRPSEVNFLLGNPNKAKTKLNWNSTYNLDQIIEEMFENS